MPRAPQSHPLSEEARQLASTWMALAWREANRAVKKHGLDRDEAISCACWLLCLVARWYDPQRGKPFAPLAAKFMRQKLTALAIEERKKDRILSIPINHTDTTRTESLNVIDDATGDPAELTVQSDFIREVKRRLSAIDWAVFQLYFFEGYTHKEIAGRLGVTRPAIQQRIQNAIGLLKRSKLRCEVRE